MADRGLLPVCPRDKTQSEVTTKRWVGENTDIPVPKVFDFDDSNANEIGFEWIFMQWMLGVTAWSRWRCLPWHRKSFSHRVSAELQSQLFRSDFPGHSLRGIRHS